MTEDVIGAAEMSQSQFENGPWREYVLNDSRALEVRIGPLTLAVQRLSHEWRAGCRRSLEEESAVEAHLRESMEWDELTDIRRLVDHGVSNSLHITPRLADRPVIIRSASSLRLPAGEHVTLYVSSPLWVRVEVGEPPALLHEVPSVRPSDTWFGPSTREGELCYAARTLGRLVLEDLPRRAHRAITPLVIRNQARTELTFQRVSLPAMHLSLFATPGGFLWTQQVLMERVEDDSPGRLRVDDGVAPEAKDGVLLTGPRAEPDERILTKAWSTLFG